MMEKVNSIIDEYISNNNFDSFLNLSNCHLSYLPDNIPPSIKNLNCNNNHLSQIPSIFMQLEKLYCDDNYLTGLSLSFTRLEELHCENNRITKLPLTYSHLKTLFCRNNPLSSLPKSYSELEYLSYPEAMRGYFDKDVESYPNMKFMYRGNTVLSTRQALVLVPENNVTFSIEDINIDFTGFNCLID